MLDPGAVRVAAAAAGAAAGLGVVAAGWPAGGLDALALLNRRRAAPRPPRARPWAGLASRLPRSALTRRLELAGWKETPERFLLSAAGITVAGGLLGAAAGSLGDAASATGLSLLGAGMGAAVMALLLRRAAGLRRRRLLAELAPTLDLLGIELSAGSSPLAGLAAVTRHGQGELAREIRTALASAAVSADRSPDAALHELGERLDLPGLVSLASILATSRDYGSGVAHGIRVLALELRRARRRDLIAASRRALSRILVPAAVGVLLPFLAILLYPAVTTLSASFR